jgi:hypothetical protein
MYLEHGLCGLSWLRGLRAQAMKGRREVAQFVYVGMTAVVSLAQTTVRQQPRSGQILQRT